MRRSALTCIANCPLFQRLFSSSVWRRGTRKIVSLASAPAFMFCLKERGTVTGLSAFSIRNNVLRRDMSGSFALSTRNHILRRDESGPSAFSTRNRFLFQEERELQEEEQSITVLHSYLCCQCPSSFCAWDHIHRFPRKRLAIRHACKCRILCIPAAANQLSESTPLWYLETSWTDQWHILDSSELCIPTASEQLLESTLQSHLTA